MWVIGVILSAVIVLLLCRSVYERNTICMNEYKVYTDKADSLCEDCRLIVLADLHDKVFGQENVLLLQKIAEAKPHAILIAGDMIIVKPWRDKDFTVVEKLLKELGLIAPVYYGNGNHEIRMRREEEHYPRWYQTYTDMLKRAGVTYLENASAQIPWGEHPIRVTGADLGDEFYAKGKKKRMSEEYLEELVGNASVSEFQILLPHTPLYLKEYADWGADLVLAGHFHGGTIRLPRLGGVMSPQFQFFTGCDKGVKTFGKTTMIVSGGLGTHSINIRINNKPDLMLVTLVYRTDNL